MKNLQKQILITVITILLVGGALVALWVVFRSEAPREAGLEVPEKTVIPKELPEELTPEQFEEFDQAIAQLDTSEKLIEFINENFILEPREGNIAYSPGILFQKKKGGMQDFAVFCAYVLDYHQYEAGIIRYEFYQKEIGKSNINTIVVFRDIDVPKYISFSPDKIEMVIHGWSFKELFDKEEERLNIEISKFGVILPGETNLSPKEWVIRNNQ